MDKNNPFAELENKYANNIDQQNKLLDESQRIQNEQINENTQQILSEIERQRKYKEQDFNKEAKGAYSDYKHVINPYGVNAENAYSNGLGNSGYSETSKLNAYNTYQNRYATAKASTDRIMEDFNNQILQAQLEGNKELAQVALNKVNAQMSNLWQQLGLDATLTGNKVNYNQWLDEFNYKKEQDKLANEFARQQFEYQKQQDALNRSYSRSNSYYDYNPITDSTNDTKQEESAIDPSTIGATLGAISSLNHRKNPLTEDYINYLRLPINYSFN